MCNIYFLKKRNIFFSFRKVTNAIVFRRLIVTLRPSPTIVGRNVGEFHGIQNGFIGKTWHQFHIKLF